MSQLFKIMSAISDTSLQSFLKWIKTEPFIISSICLLLAYISFKFAITDQLAGFSDDSGTYLIMAKYFSPFSDISINEINAYHHYHLPPGFPLVLSIFNGASNLYIPHMMVVFQSILSCVLFFYFSKKILGKTKAYIAVLIFIFTPGYWLQLLKIGSEYQYIALSFLFFLLFKAINNLSNKRTEISIILGLILAFCYLTRSIGLSLVIAFFVHLIVNKRTSLNCINATAFLSSLLSPVLIWFALKPSKSHSYINDLLLFLYSSNPASSLFETININLYAIYNGITANFSTISINNISYVEIIVVPIVILALVGMLIRIKEVDSIYVFIYTSVLLVWPYPNEMDRFILPIIPLIILYVFVVLQYISTKYWSCKYLIYVYVISIFSFTIPSVFHIYNRYNIGLNQYGENISSISELYEIEDLPAAIGASLIIKKNIDILKSSTKFLKNNDIVLTIKPNLYTYLSGIYAEELPRINGRLPDDELLALWLSHIKATKATHILLPIELSDGFNEIDVLPFISDVTEKTFSFGYMVNKQEKSTLALLRML